MTDRYAWILSWSLTREPGRIVFHRWVAGWDLRTPCGQVVQTDAHRWRMSLISFAVALLIGRPCRVCWRGGIQTRLFGAR